MSDISQFAPLWGKWEVKELIGKGSFGKVYHATYSEFGRIYESAIKHIQIPSEGVSEQDIMSEGLVQDTSSITVYYEAMLERLLAEIDTNYRLRGKQNIVLYEDHLVFKRENEQGYDIFIRMEYLTPLTKYMNQHELSEQEVVRLGIDMSNALKALSDNNILHRDIKPANIFISKSGEFKLGDFGEAKSILKSQSMSARGTYTYMSPEIIRHSPVDKRADIYSLGIVLYRLLNNNRIPLLPEKPAISNTEYERAINRRLSGETFPVPCKCSDPQLAAVVMKACAFSPSDRWQTPEELLTALIACQNGQSITHMLNNNDFNNDFDETVVLRPNQPQNFSADNNQFNNYNNNYKNYSDYNDGFSSMNNQTRQFSNGNMNGGNEQFNQNNMNPAYYGNMQNMQNMPQQSAPMYSPPVVPNTSAQQPKKSNTALIIVIILLSVILLVVAGIFCFKLASDKNAEILSNADNKSSSSTPDNNSGASSDVQGSSKSEAPTEAETEPPTESPTVKLASYSNKNYGDVRRELESKGITVEIEYEYSDRVEKNLVIKQDIPSGSQISKDDTVTLTVSKGARYSQKVVVTNEASSNVSRGTLELKELNNGEWKTIFACSASMGSNGIGENYGEGKSVTPKGIFKLGVVFTAKSIDTNMNVHYVNRNTCIVDDPNSQYYNTIQEKSNLPAGINSVDSIGDTILDGYDSALIFIEHNGDGYSSDNVVKGKGSVITICGRNSTLSPTLGCIDISSGDMSTLLSYLDADKNPHIQIK